jgi:hypothetical protein
VIFRNSGMKVFRNIADTHAADDKYKKNNPTKKKTPQKKTPSGT